jgi:hypothetical protein
MFTATDVELSRKDGNTLIGALWNHYGSDFASASVNLSLSEQLSSTNWMLAGKVGQRPLIAPTISSSTASTSLFTSL